MGSTSVRARQAGDLVAILLGAGCAGLIGLAVVVGLACAQRSPVDPIPPGARQPSDARIAAQTATAEGVAVSADAEVIRVGTSGDYAPFSLWKGDAREPEGFSIDVARAFAADRGARIEWVRFRWSELAADLEAGRFDLALSGVTVRPDRSTFGRFSLPLTATGATALVLMSSPVATKADLERPGLRIAVNRGGHLERVARTLFGRGRIEAVDANAEVPARLADGRADAVLTDDLEARLWRQGLPPTRAIGPLTRDRKAAWFPCSREALLQAFDRWLLAAESSGQLARLRHRHGLAEARTAAPLPALLARLDERLALMPAIARAKRTLARPIEDPAQEDRVRAAAQTTAARAAREFGVEPPSEPALRRFVDAQLTAARFVQNRALAGSADAKSVRADAPADGSSRNDEQDARAAARVADIARVELEERLRPAVSFLTDRIVWLAVASTATDRAASADESRAVDAAPSPTRVSRESVATALSAHALPAELVAEIHSALEALAAQPASSRAPVTAPRRATPSARAHPARPAPRDTAPSA